MAFAGSVAQLGAITAQQEQADKAALLQSLQFMTRTLQSERARREALAQQQSQHSDDLGLRRGYMNLATRNADIVSAESKRRALDSDRNYDINAGYLKLAQEKVDAGDDKQAGSLYQALALQGGYDPNADTTSGPALKRALLGINEHSRKSIDSEYEFLGSVVNAKNELTKTERELAAVQAAAKGAPSGKPGILRRMGNAISRSDRGGSSPFVLSQEQAAGGAVPKEVLEEQAKDLQEKKVNLSGFVTAVLANRKANPFTDGTIAVDEGTGLAKLALPMPSWRAATNGPAQGPAQGTGTVSGTNAPAAVVTPARFVTPTNAPAASPFGPEGAIIYHKVTGQPFKIVNGQPVPVTPAQ